MMGLTPRQYDLLGYIRESVEVRGFAPSYKEMQTALGLASKAGIHRMVVALEERGHIQRLPGRARSIFLVSKPNPIIASA